MECNRAEVPGSLGSYLPCSQTCCSASAAQETAAKWPAPRAGASLLPASSCTSASQAYARGACPVTAWLRLRSRITTQAGERISAWSAYQGAQHRRAADQRARQVCCGLRLPHDQALRGWRPGAARA